MKIWWQAWRELTGLPHPTPDRVAPVQVAPRRVTLAHNMRVCVQQKPFTLQFREPKGVTVSFGTRVWYHATVIWPHGAVADGKFATMDAATAWATMLPRDVPRVLHAQSYPLLAHAPHQPCPAGDAQCCHHHRWQSMNDWLIAEMSYAWISHPLVVNTGTTWGLHLSVWGHTGKVTHQDQPFLGYAIIIWAESWHALLQRANAILFHKSGRDSDWMRYA